MFFISKNLRNFANEYPPYTATCIGGGKLVNIQLITINSKQNNNINQRIIQIEKWKK